MNDKLQISLAAARVNGNMTQEQVAQALHVSKNTIVSCEKGKTSPGYAHLRMMCELYGITEDHIFLPKV